MMNFLVEQYKDNKMLRYVSIFFVLLTIWWAYMHFNNITDGYGTDAFLLAYPIITIFGGIYGLIFARKWGGFRSAFGSAVSMFSLGLLAQTFGQYLYNYYQVLLHIEIPYPSVGDVFYFASVVLYIIGAYQLSKVAGIKLSINTLQGKIKAFVIPLIVLCISYLVLLQGYQADWSDKMIVFLDFGYPVGQAIYLSIALLALFISKDILGGLMRKPIMLLIAALLAQFLADFLFSYQVSREIVTYYPAGTNDYLFAISYLLMTLALFSIGNMFYKVQKS